ncbi:MAG: hypothetical protein ACO3CE_05385 [Pelagibacteraceae bacterium]|jgi:hypothetical protein
MNNIYKFAVGFFTLSITYGLASHLFLDTQKGARVLFEEKANLMKKDELAKKYIENLFNKIDNNKEKKEDLEIGINYLKSKLQAHENNSLTEKKIENNLINEAKLKNSIKNFAAKEDVIKKPSDEVLNNKIIAKNYIVEKTKNTIKSKEADASTNLNNKILVSKVQSKISTSKTKEFNKSENLIVKDSNTKIVSAKNSSRNDYSKFYEIDSSKNIYRSDNQKFTDKYQQIQVARLERVKKLNEDF